MLPACLIHADTSTSYSGKYVSETTLERVEIGMTKNAARALLGEPSESVDVDEETDIWVWRYSEHSVRESHVFLVLSSDSNTERDGASYVEFRGDSVVRTWRD